MKYETPLTMRNIKTILFALFLFPILALGQVITPVDLDPPSDTPREGFEKINTNEANIKTTIDSVINAVFDALALKQDALTGLTSTVTELNYTDGVTSAIQTQIDAKLPKASTASTGTDVAFDIPRTYGYSADATGNITFTTTGLIEGMTQLMIHNDSVEPTFETGMVLISGTYVTGADNYIMFHAVSSSLILVTISQAQ